MDCYRVHIPEGVTITGFTAGGEASIVLPGEYLVHRLCLKPPLMNPFLLRFVGADARGRDVHVALNQLHDVPAKLGVTIALAVENMPLGNVEPAA